MIDYLIVYKKHHYYIHAIYIYVYNPTFPVSHQFKLVGVIVYWSDYPDEVYIKVVVWRFKAKHIVGG